MKLLLKIVAGASVIGLVAYCVKIFMQRGRAGNLLFNNLMAASGENPGAFLI